MILFFAFENERDKDVFELVFSRYKNLMYHKAYEILRDRQLAEDAVSEAFIRIYKNMDKIDDPQSNRTAAFVVTIVRNAALTMWNKEKRLGHEDLDEAAEYGAGSGATGYQGSREHYDLEEQVLFQLSKEAVFQAVDQLGEEMKNIFLLKYAYDLPHKEIARQLSITENNVTVKLHRARKKLADLLRKEGDVYEAR